MAQLTDRGITPTELAEYVQEYQAAFTNALGQDIVTASESPQGQISGSLALRATLLDELAVFIASGLNLHTISGSQVDDYGTLLGLPRRQETRTTVEATVVGTPGTIIPAGVRARTDGNAEYESTESVLIKSDGQATVTFRATVPGPLALDAGHLTEIATTVSGWDSVTNAEPGVIGQSRESDVEYQGRYFNTVATHAAESSEAIRARVLQVPGVTACVVRENAGTASVTIQGVTISAGNFVVIVEGGLDADIAQAIAETKPLTITPVGDVSHSYFHPQGFIVPINFMRVSHVALSINVSIAVNLHAFPTDGIDRIRNGLVNYVAGDYSLSGTTGVFDFSGLSVGESLDMRRILTPIHAVPGHTVTALTVMETRGSTTQEVTSPALNERYTLSADDVTISIATQ